MLVLAVMGLALGLLTGCESIGLSWADILSDKAPESEDAFKPKYVLSFHKIVKYPRAEQLEKQIETFDGQKMWINVNQFMSSKYIQEAKLIPCPDKKDFYNIELKLDRKGRMHWVQITAGFKDDAMALMVDGMFYCTYQSDTISDEEDEWVLLKGPFDAVTAKGIAKYAKQNYDFLNPSKTKLF